MPKNQVIILVPGGLGTTLSLDGWRVWDFESFPPNLDGLRMITDPALLEPWLPLTPGSLLSVYDDLIDFITNHGYVKNSDLFLWGFDWRQGMEANAAKLASFVDGLNLGGKKILFIAHSSGCLVVRWALLFDHSANLGAPMIDNALVESVVAAGPPMLGMACAFKDILLMPRLNDAFDWLFGLLRAADPSLADQLSLPLRNTLMTVTAQLEVLPPDSVPIFSGGSGGGSGLTPPFSAFEWKGWAAELDCLYASVRGTTGKLQSANLGVDCTVVASKNHPTETGYVLDANDQYASDWPPGDGDDAVLLASAKAYCPSGNLLTVGEYHRSLLDDPETRKLLASII